MKLIWHIVWKDIRSERWTLLFWAALFLGQIGLGLVVFRHDGGEHEWLDAVRAGNVILVGLQVVTGFILVTRLVHADATTGTRMFWRTRPISADRLRAAKFLGAVLLFGLLPVLLRLPWWFYCGFTARDMAWAGVETLGWQLLLVAPALLIASLTDDLGRAIMWGLLLALALLAGVLFLQAKTGAGARLLFAVMDDRPSRVGGLFFTRLWLAGFLLVLGSAAIATHQFLTQRFLRSLALVGPLTGLIVCTAMFWPWDCTVLLTQINDPEPIPDVTATQTFSGLQLAVGAAQINGTVRYSGEKVSRTWIQQNMEVWGVPPGWSLGIVRHRQSWTWPGDPNPVGAPMMYFGDWSYRELRPILGMPATQVDPETVRWMEAKAAADRAQGRPAGLELHFWNPPPPPPNGHRPLFGRTLVPDSVIDRIRANAPAGTAQVEVELGHPEKILELPLNRGAGWSAASRALRVGSVWGREENQAGLQLMMTRPAVRENGLWSADVADYTLPRRSPYYPDFIVINRHDNTIGSVNGSGDLSKSGRVVIGGVVLQWSTLHVYSARVIRNGKWVASDPDWPEHSSLVMIDPGHYVRLTRELKVEKYELLPAPSESAGAGGEQKDSPGKI